MNLDIGYDFYIEKLDLFYWCGEKKREYYIFGSFVIVIVYGTVIINNI